MKLVGNGETTSYQAKSACPKCPVLERYLMSGLSQLAIGLNAQEPWMLFLRDANVSAAKTALEQ